MERGVPHSVPPLRAPPRSSGSSFASPVPDLSLVPEVYHDLGEVFSKQRALSLSPHRPYDCAIDLWSGAPLPCGRLYNLSKPEQEAMEAYVSDSLASGLSLLLPQWERGFSL